MDIKEIKEKTSDFCNKLYKNNEITYEELRKCLGNANDIYQVNNTADIHRYGVNNTGANDSNVENKLIYIYNYNDNKKNYITANDAKLSLLDGVYVKNDATFIIERNGGDYVIKNMGSNKYITYNGTTGKLSLEDKITSDTQIKIFSYTNEENENIYKFVFAKVNRVIGIENDMLSLFRNEEEHYWNIEVQPEGMIIYEFDFLLEEVALIVKEHAKLSNEYRILFNKLNILQNLNAHIISTYNNVFDVLYDYQSSNKISVARYSLEKAKNDNLTLYEQNTKYLINEKINAIQQELVEIKNKLQELQIQYDEKVQIVTNKIETTKKDTSNIENEIIKFNKLLENNNVFIDINEYEQSTLKNKNELLKTEINKSVDDIRNGNKTRSNIYFNVIICTLILVIIVQLTMKIL